MLTNLKPANPVPQQKRKRMQQQLPRTETQRREDRQCGYRRQTERSEVNLLCGNVDDECSSDQPLAVHAVTERDRESSEISRACMPQVTDVLVILSVLWPGRRHVD